MTDPRDTEIARLTAALAESQAAEEGARMILTQIIAERDRLTAQLSGVKDWAGICDADGKIWRARAEKAEAEVIAFTAAQNTHMALIAELDAERDAALAQVAGAYEAAAQVLKVDWWGDMSLQEAMDLISEKTPAYATAALDRIKRQERMEELISLQDAVQVIRRDAGGKANGVRFQALDDVRYMIRTRLDALAATEKEAQG